MDTIKHKTSVSLIFCVVFSFMTACGQSSATLTQKMLNNAGSTFVVKDNYTANGAILHLAENQELVFDGGKIDNAIIVGINSKLKVKGNNPVFGKNVIIQGIWNIKEAHDGWFEYEKGKDFIANQLIKNMLAFSNDATFCHLFFEENRTYYFELPYHSNAKLGDQFTYHMNGDKKVRHYKEVFNDEYSFLRIFTIPSNTTVTINNTFQMLPTNQGAYFVFWEYDKENVTIEGSGTIAGDNKEHLYTTPYAGSKFYGEWGVLFRCFKCRNFTFKNITIRDAFGDCIGYGGSISPQEIGPRCSEGLLIEGVKIIGARRNGISMGAKDVVIRNCHFENCGTAEVKGTPPRCAIDFEVGAVKYYHDIGNQNVVMYNCTFKNNYYDVGSYYNTWSGYGKIATTIKNCTFTAPLKIEGTYWMRFENCYIPFVWNSKDDKSVMLYSKHMEFVNCEFGQLDTTLLGTANKNNNTYSNCKYNTKEN